MEIMTSDINGVQVIQVSGRLDARTTGELEEAVQQSLEGGQQKILMDFSDLDYINSSGLRILVMAYQRLKASGGQFAVSGIRDYILEIFEISGYDKLFLVFDSQSSALEGM